MPIKRLNRLLKELQSQVPLELEEITLAFLGPRRMARLNEQHLRHKGPTDTITYQHGEILICPQVAARQGKEHNNSYQNEVLLYFIHGWLHLAGWTDKTPAQARRMAQLQQSLLEKFLNTENCTFNQPKYQKNA